MKRLICLCIIALILFGGCAAGSATAGYSVRCKTAEELSPEAEDRLVIKIKEDLKTWIKAEFAKDKK